MIRPSYRINSVVPEKPIFTGSISPGPLDDFRGFRPLPGQWTLDWSFFFEMGDQANLQRARRIDRFLSAPTFTLPGFPPHDEENSPAFRNLRRGKFLGLPSGQSLARAMCVDPLSDADLGITDISAEFAGNAPLWLYILREAELLSGGLRLGQVGGRLVAEVLIGLLQGDRQSFLNAEPCWGPTLAENDDFRMPHLIRFALGQ